MTNHLPLAAMTAGILLAAGCAQNPDPIVRARAQTYAQLLLDDKVDEAVNFVDPDVVASKGRTKITNDVTLFIGMVKGLVQLGGRKIGGFELGKVDFDTEKRQATLQVIFFTTDTSGGNRQNHPVDQKWVLKNKTWYTTP